MGEEIERKFLLGGDAPIAAGDPGRALRQGYVAVTDDVEVRVRDDAGDCSLTVKGGHGLFRTEVELAIGRERFEALWGLTDGQRVEKTRHRITVGERVAEVDVFDGALKGLKLVEVEFPSVAEADGFQPPGWFGIEVTGDNAWSNAALARDGRPQPPHGGP